MELLEASAFSLALVLAQAQQEVCLEALSPWLRLLYLLLLHLLSVHNDWEIVDRRTREALKLSTLNTHQQE